MPDPVVSAVTNQSFRCLLTEFQQEIKHLWSVREDCYNLQRNLKISAAYTDDQIRRDARTNVARARGEEVRELVHDIEDCIERYMYRITRLDDAKWLPRIGGKVKRLFVHYRLSNKIKKLNQRLQQAGIDQIRRITDTVEAAAPVGVGLDPIQENPVGFDQARNEVSKLLDEVENVPCQLRVVAIVGFGGSGKTTLASALYKKILTDDEKAKAMSEPSRFHLYAWVERCHCKDATTLLKRIITEFWPEKGKTAAELSDNEADLQLHLKNEMKNERYLLILDDMDMNLWKWIDLTFKDKGISSRIIVTTSLLSTANRCSSSSNQQRGDGYVYQMRSLCDEGSKTLARLNEIAHDSCPCHQGQCQCPLETLKKKCDGLPLALVSTANHFNSSCRGRPTTEDCTALCKDLGSLLHKHPDNVAATAGMQLEPFADLRDVLMNNYTSLADGSLATCCLLYLGISPDARCLKKNKITRRWVAEGYGLSQDTLKSEQKQAEEIFQKLIDLNIIQPVGISTSRTCKALGIVHEFVLHKSMSENFTMIIDNAEQSRASIRKKKQKSRHLFVRGGNIITSSRATMSTDLSHVRSLTVVTVTNEGNNLGSGSACDGFFEFSKYRLLRVLDLEECSEVNNSHVASICGLWNLRYLSLGGGVNKLPNEIKRLKLLERLQLNKTKVTELPVEIIGMPCLKHLIGRFMLLGPEPSHQLVENNKVETLSGIVADSRQGFLPLVPHLKNLRKVNICFDQSSTSIFDLGNLLLVAIQGYLQHRLAHGISRSLSIDFESLYGMHYESYRKYAMDQLHCMLSSNNCYLTSLKLHDSLLSLSKWDQFAALLSGLTKLCLSLDSLKNDLLSTISELKHVLVHLKLIAKEIPQDLVIQDGKFKSLQSLCFVVRGPNGSIPKIQINGALSELRSLQLISKLLAQNLCGINIGNLTQLQEIELHAEVSPEARQEWETAAMNHPNRPDVLPLRGVDDPTGEDEGAALAGDDDAVAGATQVNHTPSSITVDSTASDSDPLEGNGRAENLTSVASPAGEEGRAVPVVTTTGNALDQEPVVNPVAGDAEATEESPIITAIPALPVGDPQVNNASNGVSAVRANGNGHHR